MVRNEETYQQAVEFRKRGFTYSEIAKICGVSKSTVSNWFAKKAFSKRVKKDNTDRAARDNVKRIGLVNKARATERNARYKEAVQSAETEFRHYKVSRLFIAGLSIYMTAGDMKHPSQIRLTSNRAETHRIFILFCEEYLGVHKKDVHAWLLLSGSTPLPSTMKWWSRKIGVSAVQFGKTQYINKDSKPLHKGTGNTIIGSTVLKRKLIRWIELAEKEL